MFFVGSNLPTWHVIKLTSWNNYFVFGLFTNAFMYGFRPGNFKSRKHLLMNSLSIVHHAALHNFDSLIVIVEHYDRRDVGSQ